MTKQDPKATPSEANRVESVQKVPYEKPFFTSEPMFETAALQACAKNDIGDPICSPDFGGGPLSS